MSHAIFAVATVQPHALVSTVAILDHFAHAWLQDRRADISAALNHDLLSRNLLSLRQSSNLPIDVPDECTPSCDSLGSVYTACAGADTQTCTDALCQQDAFNDVLDCANCVAENTPGSEQTDQTFAALSTVLAEIEGLCANANETVTGMITATGATVR